MNQATFAERIVTWQRSHGRHDLPWQTTPCPYRTWVSEIMLQQTQVSVVVDYYTRWMASFPTLESLAKAPLDTVLEHWAGLGYYARARNLHKAAQQVLAKHGGALPDDLASLEALPGIGRSTAGAILSLGFGQVAAILDGNVKRVLARHAGIEGWPGRSAVLRQLWAVAEARLPDGNAAAYTQGLMDLGASLCSRHNAACSDCPVASDCAARLTGKQAAIPAPKPKQARREQQSLILLATNDGQVLLQRRPGSGVRGGLWAPPILDANADVAAALAALGLTAVSETKPLPVVTHELTHFRWHLQPLQLEATPAGVQDDATLQWQRIGTRDHAMPAPISRLLNTLNHPESHT